MAGRTLIWGSVLVLAICGLAESVFSAGAEVQLCTGTEQEGVCWLKGSHTGTYITWAFHDVPRGAAFTLEFAALGDDPTATCRGRDVNLNVYIGEPGGYNWQRLDVRLRNTSLECGAYGYPLRATVPFTWRGGGTMFVRVRQAVDCEPHVGFQNDSLSIGTRAAPAPPPAAPPPAPPPAAPPPAPPPAAPPPAPPPAPPEPDPVEEECVLPTEVGCWVGDPTDLCVTWDPFDVDDRETLPNTHGPQQAALLSPGHYEGSLGYTDPGGRFDIRDWYRVDSRIGEGYVIWVDGDPDLVFDVYIIDVCGIVQYKLEGGRAAIYCVTPCTVPERGDTCEWYLRIDRRAGQGEYRLSLFSEEIGL